MQRVMMDRKGALKWECFSARYSPRVAPNMYNIGNRGRAMGITGCAILPAQTQNVGVKDSVEGCGDDMAMTGLGPAATELQALTTFVDEECEKVELMGKHYRATFKGNRSKEESDIKLYMSRPLLISTVSVVPVAGAIVQAILVDDVFLRQFYRFAPYVYGIRFKLRFRVQVAASPFTGGVYKLCWQPQGVPDPLSYTQNYWSKLPGVYFDICEATTGILEVPWVNVLDFWPTVPSPGVLNSTYGRFFLVGFTTFANPPTNTAPVTTTYCSLHDVEMIGAASYGTLVTPQAGGESTEVDRPISTMLRCAGTLASMATRNVPLISSFSSPVAWWSNYLANIASSYGWSKPLYTSPTQRMVITTNALHQNCDTADTSASLALTMANEIAPMPGFAGSDVDEMAMSYIVQQYASIARFTISTSDSIGLLSYGCRLGPSALWCYNNAPYNTYSLFNSTTTFALKQAADVSYIAYMANVFSLWKGDLVFKFVSNKTKFHSGRLAFCFLPVFSDASSYSNVLLAPSMSDALMCHSAVWDLKGENTFEFCCPYTAPTQYIPAANGSFGNLLVYALDPLIAASTVSSDVEITVQVKGGANTEFAMPVSCRLPPFSTGAQIIAQSGGTPCVLPSTARDIDCKFATGEKVLSVKQLITKACPIQSSSAGTLGTSILPAFYAWKDGGYSGTDLTFAHWPFCWYFSRMYGFARGSTCFDIFRLPPTAGRYMIAQYETIFKDTAWTNRAANSVQVEVDQLHIRAPYNNTTARDNVQKFAGTYNSQSSRPAPAVTRLSTNTAYMAYTRAGDDAQLGYLYGCPALALLITGNQPVDTQYQATLSL